MSAPLEAPPSAASPAAGLPRLNRQLRPVPKAPVRIVHLGLGAFHRSHQAWYTQQASDSADWGIAAFTGRRPDAALVLAEQDGLYTLVERADDGDSFTVLGSIVEAVDGADLERLTFLVAAPETAMVTLTITEAAYGLGADGRLDVNAHDVAADLALLGSGNGRPATPLGRLVLALAARRDADSGPIAVVCCDNLSNNGTVARRAVAGFAQAWDPGFAGWIDGNVSFVSTSVDRITPRTTDRDLAAVREACGYRDESPVVAEPFSSWVLSGDFPAGRPRWEDAGALFVEDIEPYENRKLWLLNGAHSLLAYAGQLRGHKTVAEALTDPECRRAVEAFWDEAEANLPAAVDLEVPDYRKALLARFGNARIAHNLAQIAMDGSTKLRMRAVPVLQAERAAGRTGAGAGLMIAAWIDYSAATQSFQDPLEGDIAAANRLLGTDRIRALLAVIDPVLAGDDGVVALVEGLCGTAGGRPAPL
ncbi:mannitol dehydrogenase family protein [Pseudarthrobacter sp. NPDC058119]|uniref:mannitol dehydrogenase family protein n=1 Tax=Pseudarthrobacter sp. NPDC058119 TaxID=3346348 RepID=UPI0036DB0E65